MDSFRWTPIDPGNTDPETLQDMAIVLTMVNDHFCMDRESDFARTLQAMVNTCYTFGSRNPTTTTSAE